jgi:predicted aspartyl protease
MTIKFFDPSAPILIFRCIIEGESKLSIRMALDTGASTSVIGLKPLSLIGIDTNHASYVTFGNATKSHYAPIVKLSSLSFGNEIMSNFEVVAHSLPEAHGIEGVLGLDFLRNFKVTIDFGEGRLTLDPLE